MNSNGLQARPNKDFKTLQGLTAFAFHQDFAVSKGCLPRAANPWGICCSMPLTTTIAALLNWCLADLSSFSLEGEQLQARMISVWLHNIRTYINILSKTNSNQMQLMGVGWRIALAAHQVDNQQIIPACSFLESPQVGHKGLDGAWWRASHGVLQSVMRLGRSFLSMCLTVLDGPTMQRNSSGRKPQLIAEATRAGIWQAFPKYNNVNKWINE